MYMFRFTGFYYARIVLHQVTIISCDMFTFKISVLVRGGVGGGGGGGGWGSGESHEIACLNPYPIATYIMYM